VVRRLQASDNRLAPDIVRQGTEACAPAVHDLMRLTAWAHLRGAGRHGADTVDRLAAQAQAKGAGWQRDWQRAAQHMALQVEKDWAGYVKASDRGAFEGLLKPQV
jgi:L-rhamnose isomerase